MRVARTLLAMAAVAALSVGCSRGDEAATPTACSGESASYLRALEDAPGEVRLEGGTSISECLTGGQNGAELGAAGQAMIEAATRLNRLARGDAGGRANLALGYLVGAVERGALRTGGIHADLQRRLEAAARFHPAGTGVPANFDRTLDRGITAGRRSG